MALDPRIILGGQQVDVVNVLAGANQAAQQQINNRSQNALSGYVAQNGAGIMAGNANALAGLAGQGVEGLNAAMGIQGQRQDYAMQQQRMGMDQQRMAMLTREEARSIEDRARTLSAEQRLQEAAQVEEAVKMGLAIQTPEEWDRTMATQAPDLVGQFQNRDALAQRFMSMAEILKKNEGPEYRPASAEEAARYGAAGGQVSTKTGKFDPINPPARMTLTTNPDGTTTFSQGPGVDNKDQIRVGAMDVSTVINDIDAIAADPKLDSVVGPLEGGGGNDVDNMGLLQRGYYGGEGLALIERIGNLQNKTWLAAREMLKGGGAITDYESKKAEGAMARLSRAKSETEFRGALKDLRDAITEGQAKLQARGAPAAPANGIPAAPPETAPIENLSDDDLLLKYGG